MIYWVDITLVHYLALWIYWGHISFLNCDIPSRNYTSSLFSPMVKFHPLVFFIWSSGHECSPPVFYLFGPPDSVYCTSLDSFGFLHLRLVGNPALSAVLVLKTTTKYFAPAKYFASEGIFHRLLIFKIQSNIKYYFCILSIHFPVKTLLGS